MTSDTILVIAPHADDEVLGCGGVIARYANAGARVVVCVVTIGAPHLFDEALTSAIRQEALAAHKLLGVVNTVFLEFHAPLLDQVPQHEVTDAIHRVVKEHCPMEVYLPHQGDAHHDHAIVHEAAMVACRPIGNFKVKRVLAYETLSETEWALPRGDRWFIPNTYVDVSGFLETKIQAMQLFGSQIRDFPHSRSIEGIRALAAYRGSTVGVHAAEAFTLLRDIH